MSKADRKNTGKPRVSMIPREAKIRIAEVLEFGMKKYDANNWRKGLSWVETLDSAYRHMDSFTEGEDFDEESGLSHLAHAATNIMFLLDYYKNHKELDDRYKGEHNE